MSKIKLFYDTLSQPSRAIKLFLLANNIPHESILVNLGKGEHYDEKYKKINPFQKVPVVEHEGFILTESVAILRYLSRELDIPDHWYPRESRLQARVDEYMEWQHLNTRLFCALYVQYKVLRPKFLGQPLDERMIKFCYNGMQTTLDQLCDVWLKDRNYLCGNTISIADLLGVTELDQTKMAGYDATEDRPILKAYVERIQADLNPHYDEVMKRLNKFTEKYNDKDLTAKL